MGKSTLLKAIFPDANYFDLESRNDFQRVSDDPELIFRETESRFVFDEAQLAPPLFNALRVEIDRHRERKDRFLLSGSGELFINYMRTACFTRRRY